MRTEEALSSRPPWEDAFGCALCEMGNVNQGQTRKSTKYFHTFLFSFIHLFYGFEGL